MGPKLLKFLQVPFPYFHTLKLLILIALFTVGCPNPTSEPHLSAA